MPPESTVGAHDAFPSERFKGEEPHWLDSPARKVGHVDRLEILRLYGVECGVVPCLGLERVAVCIEQFLHGQVSTILFGCPKKLQYDIQPKYWISLAD